MGQKSSQFKDYQREQKLRQNSAKVHSLSRALAVAAEQEKFQTSDHGWDELEQKKRSLRLLKGLFSELDAGVLPDRGANHGRVCLTLRFCADRSLLLVRLVRCQGLRVPDVRSQVCHPFVKLRLVPDPSAQGEKCSKPSSLTCDPVFEELFAFQISTDFLSNGRLFVEVWDYNGDGRPEFLGQSLVSLAEHNLTDEGPHTAWLNLNIKSELNVRGDLDISVAYESSEEGEGPVMSIKINGASGLDAVENQSTDVFVEVLVPGTPFKFHTKKVTSDTEILWEETFQCSIPQSDFERRFILFQVKCCGESAQGERSLGQAVIELEGYDPSQTLHKTIPLADLSNSDRLLEKLSQEPTTQELREALRAHAVAANPGFLFQSHMGSKVITLTARKAGSQARIQLQDGVPIYQGRE